jgi:hypothetical protein
MLEFNYGWQIIKGRKLHTFVYLIASNMYVYIIWQKIFKKNFPPWSPQCSVLLGKSLGMKIYWKVHPIGFDTFCMCAHSFEIIPFLVFYFFMEKQRLCRIFTSHFTGWQLCVETLQYSIDCVVYTVQYRAVEEFIDPWQGDKANSGTGLSYRHSRLHGWRAGTTALCRSRLYPQSGIYDFGYRVHPPPPSTQYTSTDSL